MSRPLRIALWLQAATLTLPIIVTGYWSRPDQCTGEVCGKMAPGFLFAAAVLFGLPLLIVVWFATRRVLSRSDVAWIVGVDAYVFAASALVVVVYGSTGSYLAMAAAAATAVATAALAMRQRAHAKSIEREPMSRWFRVALGVQAAALISPFVALAINAVVSPPVCNYSVCDQGSFFRAFRDAITYGIPLLVVTIYAFGDERLDGAGLAWLLMIDGWLLFTTAFAFLPWSGELAGQLVVIVPGAAVIAMSAITAVGGVVGWLRNPPEFSPSGSKST